jgi:hypothetical protein
MGGYIAHTENKTANIEQYLLGEEDDWNDMLQQTCVVLCNSRGPGETVLYVPVKPVA